MENMMTYIFGKLQYADDAFDSIAKAIKKQKRINSRNIILIAGFTAFAVLTSEKIKDQEYQIEKLEKKVDKLEEAEEYRSMNVKMNVKGE